MYSISQSASYSDLPGAAPSQKGNPNLTWEKIKSSNVGVDLSFFGRIDLVMDAYIKEASELLYRKPLAATTGYSYVWVNAGSVRNKGVEFSLTSTNIKGTFHFKGKNPDGSFRDVTEGSFDVDFQ